MQKAIRITLIISIIANIVLGYLLLSPNNTTIDSSEYTNKIDSLESSLTIIKNYRDSLRDRIDTVYINLKENKLQYEEDLNIIINNSVTDDYIFFSDYLKNYFSRYDSINNF